MMMRAAITICFSLLCGCAGSPPEVPANQTAAAPARISLTAIPVSPPRRQSNGSPAGAVETGDLDAIVKRGYLRVLIARSRTDFEEKDGQIHGRAVDAGVALEAMLNTRTAPARVAVVFIETPEERLIPDLLAGKGDVAANLLLTFERDDRVAFATPIRTAIRELIVNGPGESHVVSLEDVGNRSIHVRRSSDHHASLLRLNEQLKTIDRPAARIVVAPGRPTDEDLLDQVNAGQIPATIAYDHVYRSCCDGAAGLKTNRDVAVSQDGVQAWVTRKDAPLLLALLNEFFSTHGLALTMH